MNVVTIEHYSDALCIWAYVSQIRVGELRANFGDAIEFKHYFTQVFGDAQAKLKQRWRDRGGLGAYNKHVLEIASRFDQVKVHPDIWLKNAPASSLSCHVFLHAVRCLEDDPAWAGACRDATWALRCKFFADLVDVSRKEHQLGVAEELGLPIALIEAHLGSGRAFAAAARDLDRARDLQITVSPTLLFNDGRQRLNGNVGYRVIEANVRELLRAPEDEQSWC